jgi:hypothetical protein
MSDSKQSSYDRTRQRFDELDVEEQASFLVEATASTVARGVLQVGEVLADRLEAALRQAQRSADGGRRHGPGPAEPETAQRRRPRSGSSGATSAEE